MADCEPIVQIGKVFVVVGLWLIVASLRRRAAGDGPDEKDVEQ